MPFQAPPVNLAAAAPVVLLSAWALGLLVVDLWIPHERKSRTAWLALLGVIVTLVAAASQWPYLAPGTRVEAFPGAQPGEGGGMFVLDRFTLLNTAIVLVTAALTILLSIDFIKRMKIERGEYYVLLLFSSAGMILMAAAADLIMVFLALELLSIPLYVLAGLLRPRPDSEEAALKYFLLGSFSSAFLVYGVALIYGATGSTRLSVIVQHIVQAGPAAGQGVLWPVLLAGVGLLMVGFGFKIGAVPFHMWTPDVYQGAPTSVTAFMSVGAKVGGFAALLRVFLLAFPAIGWTWWPAVAVLAGLTMIVGNVLALVQPNIKRMLGYSSIAHAGYILIAVAAAGAVPQLADVALGAALFYLLAYTFTNLGAFAVAIAVEQEAPAVIAESQGAKAPPDAGRGNLIREYAGLGRTHVGLGLAMALFMVSLTGVPPTGGFTGKFALFSAAVQAAGAAAEPARTWMIALVLIGVVTSVISAFYYLGVVVTMFMREGTGTAAARGALGLAVVLTVLGTLWLGILPGTVLGLLQGLMG